MRLTTLTILGLLLLPLTLAAPVRNDATYPILVPDQGGNAAGLYYLSLCRGDGVHNPLPTVDYAVDDCSTSGVYQESNNVYGLQVRPGVDDEGHPYAADTEILGSDVIGGLLPSP
jgi:hypothetical protein